MTEQNGLERSSATDELRRLLDERGVEYTSNDGEYVKETCWPYMGELTGAFAEYYDGTTRFECDTWCFTPEQAIEATLGAGACRDEGDPSDFCCSKCGMHMFTETSGTYTMIASDECTIIMRPNFCPNCGRKVVP